MKKLWHKHKDEQQQSDFALLLTNPYFIQKSCCVMHLFGRMKTQLEYL